MLRFQSIVRLTIYYEIIFSWNAIFSLHFLTSKQPGQKNWWDNKNNIRETEIWFSNKMDI